jgi:cytochrome P450
MIQERREAKAQGVERADVFTNLLNASESEKGDGGGVLSDSELTGACLTFLSGLHSHWPLLGRQYCEPVG